MTSSAFSPDWIKKFSSDPYAILGVAVTADERRISKRYRQIAKQLHPDQQANTDEMAREFAKQTLAYLVNPSYQRLKQEKGRLETLATLRVKVRHLSREEKLVARGASAKQLMEVDDSEMDVFYEKALVELSDAQYESATPFEEKTAAIAELNLVYLRRQIGAPMIREKREGLVPAVEAPASHYTAVAEVPQSSKSEVLPSFAQRHIDRAKIYIANKQYPKAIKELRDAVRIEPRNSKYHTMLGQAYLLQKMGGMAKVHLRQALKLDPNNPIALKYAKKLEIDTGSLVSHSNSNGNGSNGSGHPSSHQTKQGLFKRLTRIFSNR